jgi:superfamily II DNA or RNA helicase
MSEVVLDAVLKIPEHLLTHQHVRRIARELTFTLPDPGRYGFGAGGPREVQAFTREGGYVHVPRNWGFARDFVRHHPFTDNRSEGHPINVTFNAVFRDGQQQFVEFLLEALDEDGLGSIGQASCGFGKTACATAVIAALGRTALFIVHKEKLADQFVKACQTFLGVTPVKIQGKNCDFRNAPIGVAMIQSLYQRDYGADFYRHWGLTICDETHRMAAPTFSSAICKIPAKYRMGLTATPRRGDRLEDIFFFHIGEIGSVGRGAFLDCKPYAIEYWPEIKDSQWMFRGRPSLSRLVTALARDPIRTGIICRLIAQSVRKGRKVLVLSDRVAHLDEICNRLRKGFKDAGDPYTAGVFRAGGTKKILAERELAERADVTLGTYTMAMEGLDLPAKDTLFLATPKGDVEQATGRIRRLYEGKKEPMVIDFQDQIGFLMAFARKRERFYRNPALDKNPWTIKRVRIAS